MHVFNEFFKISVLLFLIIECKNILIDCTQIYNF